MKLDDHPQTTLPRGNGVPVPPVAQAKTLAISLTCFHFLSSPTSNPLASSVGSFLKCTRSLLLTTCSATVLAQATVSLSRRHKLYLPYLHPCVHPCSLKATLCKHPEWFFWNVNKNQSLPYSNPQGLLISLRTKPRLLTTAPKPYMILPHLQLQAHYLPHAPSPQVSSTSASWLFLELPELTPVSRTFLCFSLDWRHSSQFTWLTCFIQVSSPMSPPCDPWI